MTSKTQEQKQGLTIQPHKEPVIPVFQNTSLFKAQDTENIRVNIPQNLTIQQSLDHYYNEYLRHLKENIMLNNQLKYVMQEKNILTERYNQLKKINSQQEEKKKRHRRNAHEIPRNYICPYNNCQKGYGSEGSLTQHVKIKHPDFYSSGQYQMNNLAESQEKKVTNNPSYHQQHQ